MATDDNRRASRSCTGLQSLPDVPHGASPADARDGRRDGETTHRKPWSELALLAVAGIAVLIAAAVTGALDAPEAWTLLAVLAGGYMLSGGVARDDLRLPERPRAVRLAPETRDAGAVTTETAAETTLSEEHLRVEKHARPA